MAGTVYSRFFWQDWQSDDELALCSMGAQGLWMRLLCIAARATPVGHVLISGRKPTLTQLKQIARCSEDEAQLQAWIDELVKAKVCNVSREGTLISRRLIRDAKRHQNSVKGGKARQRQIIETSSDPVGSTRRLAQPGDSATRVQSPESTIQSPAAGAENGGGSLEKSLSKAEQLCEAIGESLTGDANKYNWPQLIERMIGEGVSFEAMLLAARRKKAEGALPEDGVSTPMYFKAAALKIMRNGELTGAPARAALAVVPATAPAMTEDQWRKALQAFVIVGAWIRSEWGPSPLERGCLAPADMLARAQAIWEKQGNHPSVMPRGNQMVEWIPNDEHSLIQEAKPFWSEAA